MDLFAVLLFLTLIIVVVNVALAFKVHDSGLFAGRYRTSYTINSHRKWVNWFLLSTLLAIGLIESTVAVKHGSLFEMRLFHTYLGQVHLALDIIFLTLAIIMRWAKDGEYHSELHKKLAKVVRYIYVGILITGTWLMIKL
jgi:preprotein translocase subunit SecG